jgi:hypothetical protein
MPGRATRITTSAFAAVAVAMALFPSPAGAVAGQPDSSFGDNGFTIIDEPSLKNEFLTDLVVLPDGKILGGPGPDLCNGGGGQDSAAGSCERLKLVP